MIRRCFPAVVAGVLLLAPRAIAAEDRFFDSNGVKIRYQVHGTGTPVLLIHGFTANIEVQWGVPGILKALAQDYQVVAYDNRGHGKSGKPHDSKQYGMEMVEDGVRLLDHLRIKKAHIVGYSMGAMLACKLMTAHPDRCLSATLGGGGGVREGADFRFFDLLGESLEKGKGFGLLIAALTPEGGPRPDEAQVKSISDRLSAANDTKALGAAVKSWKDLSIPDDKLKANQVPALILIGDKDPLKRRVDELKPILKNVEEVVIEGGDHISTFAKPEFTKSLKEFLAKNGTSDRKE
jgi:pimeloyl-ACP methyl ester carboxylesterase